MADQKPPRSVADERTTLLSLLQYQRDSLAKKVSGTDDVAARRTMVPSGTSLLWLIKHVANAESIWILQRFAGERIEFGPVAVMPDDTVESTVAAYRRTWAQTDRVIAGAANLDLECRGIGREGQVNLRWVLMHLLEETARHAGHADIIRELIDGEAGR
jgi:hypothetical protein